MRIIYLNCWWDSLIFDRTLEYVNKSILQTDIFCLVEITSERFERLNSILKPYSTKFAFDPSLKNAKNGQAMFVRNNLNIQNYKQMLLYDSWDDSEVPGYLQTVDIKNEEKTFKVACLQGMAHPGNKNDTDMRIDQSKKVLEFIGDTNLPTIVGGDLNLNPGTESIKMFEKAGYRNLVKEFNIKDTRGKINHEIYKDDEIQYFADYIFVSPGIKVKKFEVPNVEISDHLPLVLDFEL